jgi:hypothetical protein
MSHKDVPWKTVLHFYSSDQIESQQGEIGQIVLGERFLVEVCMNEP